MTFMKTRVSVSVSDLFLICVDMCQICYPLEIQLLLLSLVEVIFI